MSHESISVRETTTSDNPAPPNLPCGDLLGNRDDYNKICVPLFNASMKCDWKAAQAILDEHPHLDLLGFGITENYDTALHIAVSAKSNKLMEKFVENIVNKMRKEQLALQNKKYLTALFLAAAAGNVKIARTLVEKNRNLLDMPGYDGKMPLEMASTCHMMNFLYDHSKKMTGDFWTDENRVQVLKKCVENDYFDVALKMVTDRPELSVNDRVLLVLARKTDACKEIRPPFVWRAISQIFSVFGMKIGPEEKPSDAMRLLRISWTNVMQLPMHEIPFQVLFVAAEMGNTEFVVELIRQYPDLLWKQNDNDETIFHIAIRHRHVEIYNLLHEVGSMKDINITHKITNDRKNSLSHLAAELLSNTKSRDQNVSGVILEMQRELLWFKEVEALVPFSYREMKNVFDDKPHQVFEKAHTTLLSENEKWLKDTANQCLVVATLIASIGFAGALAVPGGYNQNNGIPIFLHNPSFIAFAISDAISLAFSSISILQLLSIFISPSDEIDFLEALPKRLMRGLISLFVSITTMLVGFAVSFFTVFQDKLSWVPIIMSIFISIPVILYVRLLRDVLMDVYRSTYGAGNLFKPKKLRLYPITHQNPTL